MHESICEDGRETSSASLWQVECTREMQLLCALQGATWQESLRDPRQLSISNKEADVVLDRSAFREKEAYVIPTSSASRMLPLRSRFRRQLAVADGTYLPPAASAASCCVAELSCPVLLISCMR